MRKVTVATLLELGQEVQAAQAEVLRAQEVLDGAKLGLHLSTLRFNTNVKRASAATVKKALLAGAYGGQKDE